jgi:hypothetical protein
MLVGPWGVELCVVAALEQLQKKPARITAAKSLLDMSGSFFMSAQTKHYHTTMTGIHQRTQLAHEPQ